MKVQYAEPVTVVGVPGLFLPAEMEDRRVPHHPGKVRLSQAAHKIVAVISGIVVPNHVVQRQYPVPVQGVEHILIRQHQILPVLLRETENRLRICLLYTSDAADEL